MGRWEWWSDRGSNPGPSACKADALPAELPPHSGGCLRVMGEKIRWCCVWVSFSVLIKESGGFSWERPPDFWFGFGGGTRVALIYDSGLVADFDSDPGWNQDSLVSSCSECSSAAFFFLAAFGFFSVVSEGVSASSVSGVSSTGSV